MDDTDLPLSVSDLSAEGNRCYNVFHLDCIIQACLPVTELKTRSKGEIRELVNKNFKKIVMKADLKAACPQMGCDVPPESEFLQIKQLTLHKWSEGEFYFNTTTCDLQKIQSN